MDAILGFVGKTPQMVSSAQVGRSLDALVYRGLKNQGILLFDSSTASQLHFSPITEHVHSSDALHGPVDAATAMLACHCVSKESFSFARCDRESQSGRQLFVAFDGILDNESELRQELAKLGHSMHTTSHLEVATAAFDHWGPDCLSRLIGSFSVGILDFDRRSLILARDTFGTRPLFYTRQDGWGLFFASSIGALFEIASAPRRVNRKSLYRYLAYDLMEHGAETFFAGVEQIPPGHYLEVPLDNPTQSSAIHYRRIEPVRTTLTFGQAAEHLKDLVTRSVATQVGANNGVGAALSGGFDSSFVVAAFKRAQPNANLRLYTCAPVVRNGTFTKSEEGWAGLAAAGFQIPIRAVRVTSEGLPESFATLVHLQEQPFSSPVIYASLQIFRAAQEDGVKIMLSGQGGDTLFAASADQLLLAAVAHACRGHLGRAAAIIQVGRHLPQASIRRLATAAARMAMPKSWQAFARSWRQPASPNWLRKRWFEFDPIVVPDESGLPMLRFEDRNSMACAILNRMPLLTTELQDFVSSLPPEYLITKDQPMKSIEAEAMRGIVPDAILARRERSGFPVPIREWLVELAPWVESNMATIESFPFMEPRRVRQTWESVRSLKGSVSEAFLIWRWVFLAGWVRHCSVSVE